MKEYWTDFCVKYTCNAELLNKTGQKWFVKDTIVILKLFRFQYFSIMDIVVILYFIVKNEFE